LNIKKETEVHPYKELFDIDLVIPSHVLRDRKLSALEAIIEYLKEVRKLSYHEISKILNRDERNIWTLYNRAKKKREND
jgi:hypothetical protein